MTAPTKRSRVQVSGQSGWMPNDESFGARLALIRQRMGWGNVKEAAEQCGLPVQSWRTWERDNVQPRRIVDVAALISSRTGCDLSWLVFGRKLSDQGGDALATVDKPMRPGWTSHGGPDEGPLPDGSVDWLRRPRRVSGSAPGVVAIPAQRMRATVAS
jgi:hypothetical protein